jgi:hypothetical protein
MKSGRRTATQGVRQALRTPGERASRPRHGHLEGDKAQSRAQQKSGAYKRVEIFLGVEAAIALRRLMRDGRSAREVIEALLRAEVVRQAQGEAPRAGRPP